MTDAPRQFRISVTDLAEFCCRRGDLNLGLERSPTAQEGQQGQRALQQDCPMHYQREVAVSTRFGTADFSCILSGRIDGLQNDNIPLLEEIKTTYCSEAELPAAQRDVHLAQLRLYGGLFVQDQPCSEIRLQLRYFKCDDATSFSISSTASGTELQQFLQSCIAHYSEWLSLHCRHLQLRDQYLQQLPFPFQDFRPGQRQLSVQVYRDLRDKQHGLYQAATGLGKTSALLFPALKLLGQNGVRQIWYLTAKNSGQRSVTQSLQQLALQQQAQQSSGPPPLRVLFLAARDRQCFCDDNPPDLCQWQQGYYDRLHEARLAFQQQGLESAEALAELAQRFQLCPHQLSRHLLPWVDLVVADFNYVFDPQVRLRDYLDAQARQIALLIDEAHNLSDRAREMFSNRLYKAHLTSAAQQIGDKSLQRRINRLLKHFPANGTAPQAQPAIDEKWLARLAQLSEHWLDWFARQHWLVFPHDLFATMLACVQFSQHAHNWQPQDRLISCGEHPAYLEIFCTDPAPGLHAITSAFHAAVFFSGSLLPLEFFSRALSDQPFASQLNLPSPFPPHHQLTLIVPVNTRYEQRAASVAAIVAVIATVWNSRPGRYLVSFPSYQYLLQVQQHLQHSHPDLPLLAQTGAADGPTPTRFLQALAQDQCLALVISGGVYAEGLDLQDNGLHGVIIVGTCMPPPSLQRELMRQGNTDSNCDGFDFAYRFPGVNRVIQTAGRVIRSASDRGLVILVDDRFARADTRRLLPSHWQPGLVRQAKDLQQPLLEFWSAPV